MIFGYLAALGLFTFLPCGVWAEPDIVCVICFGHEEMMPPMDWNVATQLDWTVIKCGLCILLSFRQFFLTLTLEIIIIIICVLWNSRAL